MATPWGIGMSPDSTQYLATARNLTSGKGLYTIWWSGHAEPLTHFPPLYPLAIAALSSVGMSPERAGWLLQLLLSPLNSLLMVLLATRMSGGTEQERARLGLAVASVAMAATDIATAHAMLWSEPMYLSLLMCTLLMLWSSERRARRFEKQQAQRLLWAAAVCAGLSTLTRFVGIALIVSCGFALLLFSAGGLGERIKRAATFGVVGFLPLLGLVAFNVSRAGSASNRELGFHPVSSASLLEGANTALHWISPFMPWRVPRLLALALLGVSATVLVAMALVARTGMVREDRFRVGLQPHVAPAGTEPSLYLIRLAVTVTLGYVGFLVVSISFADVSTELDARILLPVQVMAIVLVGATLEIARRAADRTESLRIPIRWALGVFFAVLLVTEQAGVITWTRKARAEGLGLASIARSAPALFSAIDSLPRNVRVYSNMPYLIYFATNRITTGLPRRVSPTSLRPNTRFETEMRGIVADSSNEAFVVRFTAGEELTFVASESDVESRLHVDPILDTPSGRIDRVGRGLPPHAAVGERNR
ncbi:MAG: hypothetical protein ABJE47_21165 [bacterium]